MVLCRPGTPVQLLERQPGSRISDAPLRAASHPGHESTVAAVLTFPCNLFAPLTRWAVPHLLSQQQTGTEMADKVSDKGNPLGPIGTKVLFENEHIRVWSVELGAKGHQPLHEHEHPYLIVPV